MECILWGWSNLFQWFKTIFTYLNTNKKCRIFQKLPLFTLIFLCLWPCLSDNLLWVVSLSLYHSTKITVVLKINYIHDFYFVSLWSLLLAFFQFQGFFFFNEISIGCLKSINCQTSLPSSYLTISLFGVRFGLIHGLFLNRVNCFRSTPGFHRFLPLLFPPLFFLIYVVLQGVQAELVDLCTKRKTWIEGKPFPVEKGLTL